MTPREYAKHRGCAKNAVDVALKSGRLPSATRDAKGRWSIDPDAADREWEASTRSERRPLSGPTGSGGESLAESRARLDAAKADLAELDLAERRRELVPAKDVAARLVNVFTSCKTKLLGLPSRARQQDPTFTAAQITLFEELLREALEGLAADGADDDEEAAA